MGGPDSGVPRTQQERGDADGDQGPAQPVDQWVGSITWFGDRRTEHQVYQAFEALCQTLPGSSFVITNLEH